MTIDLIYFTETGLRFFRDRIKKMEAELEKLQEQTAEICQVGGNQYHDNFSYEQLVIQIRGMDWRVNEAYKVLRRAEVVEQTVDISTIGIGNTVKFEIDGEERFAKIVGYGESNPEVGLLAYDTPLAKQLIGHKIHDVINGVIAEKEVCIVIFGIGL